MRQLKFRSWNGKSMQYGGFSIHCTGKVDGSVLHADNPLVVMQFTGLIDVNGKEVYEGDIIARTEDHNLTQIVTWGESSHWRGMDDGYNVHHIGFSVGEYFFSIDNFVVVGNIHQNPELLK